MINHLFTRSFLSGQVPLASLLFRKSSASTTFSPSHLLTLATAKQLKGDISDAINLANQALTKQREGPENDQHGLADTSLFLGKLLQLDRRYLEAEALFIDAHRIHQLILPRSPRNEFTALSHVAQVQKRMKRFSEAEHNFIKALNGLKVSVGW